MAATDIANKPVHSDTIQEWASSAAGGDAESAPADGEIIAGHVNNTGLTSGRANWLMRAVSQLYKRVRDTLLPQHEDNGNHWEVVATGGAGNLKLSVRSNAADIASTAVMDVRDDGGATVIRVREDGDVEAKAFIPINTSYGLHPSDFSPLSPQGDDDVHYDRDSLAGWARQEVGDSTVRYLVSRSIHVPPGSRVTDFEMFTTRPTNNGQVVECRLYRKAWNTAGTTLVATVTRNSGTGTATTSQAGLTSDVADGQGLFVCCDLDNGAETATADVWTLTPVNANSVDYYAGCSLADDPSGEYVASYLSDGTATVQEIVEGLQAVLAAVLPAAVAVATEDNTKVTLTGPTTGQHLRPTAGSSAAGATWTVANTIVGGGVANAVQLNGCRVVCIPTP